MSTLYRARREIVSFGKMLHSHGFVAATDGNLSVRLNKRHILATPTAMSKGVLRTSDLVTVDMDGNVVAGNRHASSEIAMHLLIYRLRPEIGGIVHAHPPTATGFAAAGLALDKPLVCEVVIGLGSIPLAKYGTPGTPELCETLRPLVSQYDAILMSNHGVVTYGETLSDAYMKMETVEHFAQIALVTHLLGRTQPLGNEDLKKLLLARSKYEGTHSAAPLPLANSYASNNGDGRKSSRNAGERRESQRDLQKTSN
jgi:L-fuculose-phosphate aldolase